MDAVSVSRMPQFVGAVDPTAAIRTVCIAVAGTGSVGSNAALHLARLGVGALVLVDRDRLVAHRPGADELDVVGLQQPAALGFAMDVGQTATQALFFRHARDTVAVERIEGHFTVEAATLLEIAPALADKLKERRGSYLEALEI